MAVHVLALYHPPADPNAFDRYYYDTHLPIAKGLPGLRDYTVSASPVTDLQGTAAPYHLIANLTFDSLEDVQKALASPAGAATAGDIPNFATGGATIYLYEVKSV
jgi:uncharacterized protein (TIGR02118 family)